jgi:hypothetical protein
MEETSMPSTFINGMGRKVKGKSGDLGKTRTSDMQFRKLLKANSQNLMKSEVCQYLQILAAFFE